MRETYLARASSRIWSLFAVFRRNSSAYLATFSYWKSGIRGFNAWRYLSMVSLIWGTGKRGTCLALCTVWIRQSLMDDRVSLKFVRIWQDFTIQFDCLLLCFSTLFWQLESRKKLRHMNDILKICIVSLWLDLRRINLFCMFCVVVHVLVVRILRACFSSEYPEWENPQNVNEFNNSNPIETSFIHLTCLSLQGSFWINHN